MAPRRPPGFESSSLNPLGRRLRQLALRLGGRFVHRHRVERLRIGDATFKRVRFGDSGRAEVAARALAIFEGTGAVPRLYERFDDELLVEFVEGERLARIDPAGADALARFYATIHAPDRRTVATAESGVPERLARDLDFLVVTGVIDTTHGGALRDAAERLAPTELTLGWDYTDGVAKNFVWRDDATLVGVDVEALQPDALIGIGLAKVLARGDAETRARLIETFDRESGLDLEKALPFVELCGEVRWLKRRVLKGSAIEPDRLERFTA